MKVFDKPKKPKTSEPYPALPAARCRPWLYAVSSAKNAALIPNAIRKILSPQEPVFSIGIPSSQLQCLFFLQNSFVDRSYLRIKPGIGDHMTDADLFSRKSQRLAVLLRRSVAAEAFLRILCKGLHSDI